MKTINELCDIVRETAYAIHVYHGHGHLEKVYENALVHRLRKAGIDVKQQHPIQVCDEDIPDAAQVIGQVEGDVQIGGGRNVIQGTGVHHGELLRSGSGEIVGDIVSFPSAS